MAWLNLRRVIRKHRGAIIRPGELERDVELAARYLGGPGAILILLDADDDCPAHLGPELLQRARSSHAHLELSVVLAMREFESWFLAGAASLAGQGKLASGLESPANVETIRDAKGWLSQHRGSRAGYSPTIHQASFAACIDLEQARSAPSFDKFCRDVARLIDALSAGVA